MTRESCGCRPPEKNISGGRVGRVDELLRVVSKAGLPGRLMAGCVFEDISKEINLFELGRGRGLRQPLKGRY